MLLQAMAPRVLMIEQALAADVLRIRELRCSGAADGAQIAVIAALCDLITRPAKRVRSALMCVVAEAYGHPWDEAISELAVSLEWLQVYLLVHDDWMDHDDVRRGGPSVPAMMRASFPQHADAAAVLAGDLAHAFAQEALVRAVQRGAPVACYEVFAHMHAEVVLGQLSDVLVEGDSLVQVELRYAQKTASYTTVGPMRLGALFGAPPEAQEHIARAALLLGVAFQIRDDVLGVERDEREQKNTWVRVRGALGIDALQAAASRIRVLVQDALAVMPAPVMAGPSADVVRALCTYLLETA